MILRANISITFTIQSTKHYPANLTANTTFFTVKGNKKVWHSWCPVNTKMQSEPAWPANNNKTQLSSITTSSKNSPAFAPPVFSSMVAEPIKENGLCRANPPTGRPALSSSSHSSLSSLSTGQRAEFNTTRAAHRHSGTVDHTVHWTTPGYAHRESQQGLAKQLSFPQSALFSLFL